MTGGYGRRETGLVHSSSEGGASHERRHLLGMLDQGRRVCELIGVARHLEG